MATTTTPTTRTTTFIAVQCSQCSTMQVKQLKKSSNKWVCAVCNQRQSVRHIHARGPLARDIRKFVQAFNISRCDLPPGEPHSAPLDGGGCHASSNSSSSLPTENDRKRRMDWSEYLDPDEEPKEDEDTFEPNMFAVMSEKKFPKRSFTRYPHGAQAAGIEAEWNDDGSLLKSTFVKRTVPRCGANKGKAEFSLEQHSLRIIQQDKMAASMKGRSKWSEYLEEEGEEEGPDVWDRGTEEQHVGDIMVEEEVHPDFKQNGSTVERALKVEYLEEEEEEKEEGHDVWKIGTEQQHARDVMVEEEFHPSSYARTVYEFVLQTKVKA